MPPTAASGGDAAVLEAPVRQAVQPVQPAAPAAAPQSAAPAAQPAQQQADDEDDLPPWVTEFSDDSAVAQSAPQGYAPPAPSQSYAPSHSPSAAPAPANNAVGDGVQAFVAPARAAPAPAKAPYALSLIHI